VCPAKWILKELLSQITKATAEMLDAKLGNVFYLYDQLVLGETVLYVWQKRSCTKQLSISSHLPDSVHWQNSWSFAELLLMSAGGSQMSQK